MIGLLTLLSSTHAFTRQHGASTEPEPQLRYPDPDIGVNSLAARKKAQMETVNQFKVFYQFQFTDKVKESGVTFVHHAVGDLQLQQPGLRQTSL